MTKTRLEQRFHQAMLDLYEKIGKASGYWPHRFRQLVRKRGGVHAARYLLERDGVGREFLRLKAINRLDLSVEALVLRSEWHPLFSVAERERAMMKLYQHGMMDTPALDAPTLDQLETALLKYYEAIEAANFDETSKHACKAHARLFINWLKGDPISTPLSSQS